GLSLDDKRAPLLVEDKLGVYPSEALEEGEHELNNLPDVLTRWLQRDGSELENSRTSQSFCVPKEEIVGNDYYLSFNLYKEMVYEEVEYDPPQVILSQIKDLHNDIAKDIAALEEMLG
ncbi:DNA methyltransferase, partial [Alphaproteobacteria bacterium]|nr:DNA methyltransferase [Alphaproteobacteria bacterium]